jgi:P27 family predicted phage terminase small subunit
LKLLRGNPGKQRIHDGMRPEQSANVPDPPSFIVGYASDEWWSVATELHRLGVLSKIDLVPLAAYCQSYAVWREATELLASMQADPMKGYVIRNMTGGFTENPLLYTARKAATDMMKFASEFGLTPAARSRISSGVNGDEQTASKFDGLLAR